MVAKNSIFGIMLRKRCLLTKYFFLFMKTVLLCIVGYCNEQQNATLMVKRNRAQVDILLWRNHIWAFNNILKPMPRVAAQ